MLLALIDHTSEDPSSQVVALPHKSTSASDLTPEALYERVAPSVVTIIVNDEDGEAIGSGSGFFVDGALLSGRYELLEFRNQLAKSLTDGGSPIQFGYVITNYHVIRPAVSVDIVLSSGEEGPVLRVIAQDERADLALLLVSFPTSQLLKGIPFAMQNPCVLSTVYAIGSPMGFRGSACEGEVSGFRELPTGGQWLQTTAPISPGSSGGPLLLPDGTLAGVTTMFMKDAQNLNFAVPVSAVRKFLTTTPFEVRDVAEGASIKWARQAAFSEVRFALESQRFTEAETNALVLLASAEETELGFPCTRAVELAREPAMSLPEELKSLPDEFKYLAHYVIGQAHWWVAVQSVYASDPNDQFTEAEFASRYRSDKHASASVHHLVEAIKLQPKFSPTYEQLYQHYESSGDKLNGLVAAIKLVFRAPRSASALNIRARCYAEFNQLELAKKDLQAAIEMSPNECVFYGKLADLFVESGEYSEAISNYETAIELDEHDIFKGGYYFDMGIAYYKDGNVKKAKLAFTRAKDFGYPADDCDRQIAECQQRRVLPVARLYAPPSILQGNQATVYVTKSGRKYHRDGCEYLAQSKIPLSQPDAALMYEPCSRCHSPAREGSNPDSVDVAISQRLGPHD